MNRIFCRYNSTSSINHYKVLGLSSSCTDKDVKKKYRELSKKYHPDLNSSLSLEQKERNSEMFIKITKSYEVLSDKHSRKTFDQSNSHNLSREQELQRREFHNRYYGSSSSSTRASGLNSTRNRVKYTNTTPNFKSIFNGEFRSHSVNDVPHFDYGKHLRKNINVDKRYSETHGFKNNDYMIHVIRNQYSGNTEKRNSTIYTRQETTNSKAPIVVTMMTAISLLIFISGGEEKKNSKVNMKNAQ